MKRKVLLTTLVALLLTLTACGGSVKNNKTSTQEDTSIAQEAPTLNTETSEAEEEKPETTEETSTEEVAETETEITTENKDVAGEVTFNVTDTSATKYASTSLNVREFPDSNGTKIGSLNYNQSVEVTGTCDNGWSRINYNGVAAYVNSSYLMDEKVVEATPTQEPDETPAAPVETPAEAPAETTVVVGKEGTYNDSLAREAANLVNQIRTENGLGTLSWDDGLVAAAKTRAAEASVTWSHTRPDGSAWSTVSSNISGENLAKGYNSAQDAVNAWMASQGHKENILRGSFTRTAVAFFETDNGWFWCQAFGY